MVIPLGTLAQEVYDSFESSFQDKKVIPDDLELVWLKKAIGRYSVELGDLTFDDTNMEFSDDLNQYVIDTLGAYMKQSYQEREVSKANKRASIVGKDISIDGQGHTKTAMKNELEYDSLKSTTMAHYQKSTAYN